MDKQEIEKLIDNSIKVINDYPDTVFEREKIKKQINELRSKLDEISKKKLASSKKKI